MAQERVSSVSSLYLSSTCVSSLSSKHQAMLHDESGISEEVIAARGYRTITDPNELKEYGFSRAQQRAPGLLLPLWAVDGHNSLFVYRPDNPRVIENKKKGRRLDGTYPCRVLKYELPKGCRMRLDCPPTCQPSLADPSVSLWITEGQKKADSLASRGVCAIALLGVWNWRGRNDAGGLTVLPDWEHVALAERQVNIVFDSDAASNPQIQKALERLKNWLRFKKATVDVVYLPRSEDGKHGVDDYLAAGHTMVDLEGLLQAPRPELKPAPPIIELLDDAPATIRRPLALVDGSSYAATWPYVKVTVRETVNKAGEIVRHDPPIVNTERRLFIVRGDGTVFSGDEVMDALGLEVRLPEIPPPNKLWPASGVEVYRAGRRPDPPDVFSRVVDVVSRFIDFDRSLADQRVMSELVACYILSTWFLDAFTVVGFIWPNGDRGSGKTQLLSVIAELAYLGQVILAGGSYASLRDLADYGATLAFDDAENLADSRRTDPDKRALLLAGNRKGAIISVKEPRPDRTWQTRYVNTFCPRLFSAIRLPDPVLASRTIVIPLIRTPDRYRANADPLDYKLWPHDRRALVSDLWALALAHLPELPAYEAQVNDRARLTGRNLEPWRALLAVALWLDALGATGLWERMEGLSMSYQNERAGLEFGDLQALVIQGLCQCAASAVCDTSDTSDVSDVETETPRVFFLKTSQVTDAIVQIAKEGELDVDPDRITSRKVGRALGKMRLEKAREGGTALRGRFFGWWGIHNPLRAVFTLRWGKLGPFGASRVPLSLSSTSCRKNLPL